MQQTDIRQSDIRETRMQDDWRDRPATAGALITVVLVAIFFAARPLFGMSPGGAIALFFIVWWTTLFAVLPFGVRSQIEEGHVVEGSEPGAPTTPRLVRKALWTTIIAIVVFTIAVAVASLLDL